MAKAKASISKSAIETLELAFTLAYTDIKALPSKLVARLNLEIAQFIRRAPEGEPGSDTAGLWAGGGQPVVPPSLTDVMALQRSVRALLEALARRGPPREDEIWHPAIRPVVHADGRVQLVVDDGSIHDRYMLALIGRLQTIGADRVRPCGICKRAFLRQTRALYCGRPECRRAVVLAAWHRNKEHYRPTPKGRKRLKTVTRTNKRPKGEQR